MCLAEFIAKYVLFLTNLVFSLAGITIIVLASIVLGQLRDVQDILPINIIPISLIVLGCIIFIIAFLACCGAVRESRCMLISYSICMMVLAGVKIYLSVVVYEYLNVAQETVTNWLNTGFNNTSLRPAFHTMEALFRCCGTVGPSAYGSQPLPPTCCEVPQNTTCAAPDAFGGCNDRVTDYLETFGGAIGGVLLFVIIFEVVLIVLACFFQCRIAKK